MLILLRNYELNTIIRRLDDREPSDLTRAKVLTNSVRFSEDKLEAALETALGRDFILHLDLRLLPDGDTPYTLAGGGPLPPLTLPPLDLPDPEQFVYREAPGTRVVKTYRLEYVLEREGRQVEPPYETEVDGERTVVVPAPPVERIVSSLECEVDDLRQAVRLLGAPANGGLIWLRVTVHDDAFRGDRLPKGMSRAFAEPSGQIRI